MASIRLLITELNELRMSMLVFLPMLTILLLTLSGVGNIVLIAPDRFGCDVIRVMSIVYVELLGCVT